ncbi:hypothetical protein JAAARDRAFT_42280 [Jaapia argillacea MUCL 33604]|uniref:G-patch domain-containing protein n=1 Tax=Jaapia argillacea MUCL 33604 TaxID=933084 RepID=A0A067P5U7_9AGAM|nr:hypothetical protein JAAARDRAFT_42280 [Jaapia argillacea MUCL 33604]
MSKVSFTVRRPTPISRNSSGGDSDSQSTPAFKLPALPRHLTDSNPGSPLVRSATSSPKPQARTYNQRDDSSDESEGETDELVTGFDQFGVQRLHEKKKKEGPLVIPALRNRDWREFAKKRKGGHYIPPSASAETGADGSVGGLGTRDSINSGPQRSGLHFVGKQEVKIEEAMEDVEGVASQVVSTTDSVEVKMEDADAVKKEDPETEDQRALRAILASVDGSAPTDGPLIDAIPIAPLSEADAYRQDVEELPEPATLDDYTRVPVSQFGAAMLRGMGWKEGQAASRTRKGLVEPWLPAARPALLGIGAKEKEVFDDGDPKKRKAGKREAMKYVPLIKKQREGSGGADRSREGSRRRSPDSRDRSATSSRRPSRSPSPDGRRRERDRDDRDRRRDKDYERSSDRPRDSDSKRDYDRDRDRDRRRDDDRSRDYGRSSRDKDGERRRDRARKDD